MPFSISTEHFSSPGLIEVVPISGKVLPNEKLKVLVRFRPGIPRVFAEKLQISVAHFDPVHIMCYGSGSILYYGDEIL